jgi:aspartyl-tRNA(Asn)/glutamyl-tRNA(Gln) amidotransferase subunit C
MTKEEIVHLGTLSRLALSTEEVDAFLTDIDAILAYVSTVTGIAGDAPEKSLGARYNVLRPDVVTNEPGYFTEALLAAAPHTSGKYVAVKKIIDQSS